MSALPLFAWALPALAGTLVWLFRLSLPVTRAVGIVVSGGLVAIAVALVALASQDHVLVHAFGGWAPPFGIVFVADRLSSLFVLLQAILLFFTMWSLDPGAHGAPVVRRAIPLLLILSSALSGAFLTGDLFNLFVMFEVVLLTSYLLLQVPGTDRSLRAAFPNLAINLVASLFLFVGVGILYGACGTVNMADLAVRIGQAPPALRTAALSMLVVAFGIKAGLVPLQFWLPATYPAMNGPTAAFFAGMMTKLGVYALFRSVPLLMPDTLLPTVLVWVGAGSALVAVVAALSQYELRRLLGFHITSQVGYMVLGLGLLTPAAVAGAIFYLVHHVLVKTALFLVADHLERGNGTRDLRQMVPGQGGPWLAAAFVIAGFSLAGLPPFSGFFAKLGLFRATLDESAWALLCVLVIASAYTLVSMLKIWRYAFFGEGGDSPRRSGVLVPLIALVTVSVSLAVLGGPAFRYAEEAARQVLDVGAYVASVASAPGRGLNEIGGPK